MMGQTIDPYNKNSFVFHNVEFSYFSFDTLAKVKCPSNMVILRNTEVSEKKKSQSVHQQSLLSAYKGHMENK